MSAEIVLRIGSFLAMLIIMGVAETIWPRRQLDVTKGKRWFSNLSVSVISSLLARLIIPIAPVGAAIICAEHNIGLLNTISLPSWIIILISILLLDMLIYWQHVAFHRIQLLWRIHRMHHADLDIDASTGIRFHPLEIITSVVIKLIGITILGPPAIAVITFEILLNGCALFNHANVRLPLGIDAILRLFIVTPDMHRVHHSTDMREANMNYGFNFPWWDRIFGTYKSQPDLGHDGMRIGMNIFREPKYVRLDKMLTIPFL